MHLKITSVVNISLPRTIVSCEGGKKTKGRIDDAPPKISILFILAICVALLFKGNPQA
jgi:hypothetical protein